MIISNNEETHQRIVFQSVILIKNIRCHLIEKKELIKERGPITEREGWTDICVKLQAIQ